MSDLNTTDGVIDAAWGLANGLSNVIRPALRGRDELIRNLIRDHERDAWLGTDYYVEQALALGIEIKREHVETKPAPSFTADEWAEIAETLGDVGRRRAVSRHLVEYADRIRGVKA